jgi:hypothetical protein
MPCGRSHSVSPFILYIIVQQQIVAGISTTGLAGR